MVTLVGWVVTLKATLLLALPSDSLRRLYAALGYQRWFTAYMVATFILGVALDPRRGAGVGELRRLRLAAPRVSPAGTS